MGCTRAGGGRTCEEGQAGAASLGCRDAGCVSRGSEQNGTVGIRAADSQQAAEKSECTEETMLGGKCGWRDSEGNTHFY